MENKKSNVLITLLLLMQVISWILFMPASQIQMMIFEKRIISFVHYGVIEILLIILLVAQVDWKLKINKNGKENIFLCVMFFISLLFNIVKTNTITPFVILFYLMFWIFPIFIIWILDNFNYNPNKFLKFMLLIVVLHAIIIFYQHYTNSAFWPYLMYDDSEVAFKLDSYYSTDKYAARCGGMTGTGLEAGILLMFGIVLVIVMPDFKKRTKICLLVLFTIATYFSGTRNIYVMIAYIFAMVMLMRLKILEKNKISVMIFITVVLALIYFFVISSITSFNTTGNLFTDTTSIGIRLKKWKNVIESLKDGSIFNFFFGCIQWQNAGNCMIIDNMYLELIYCSGIMSAFYYIRYVILISKAQAKTDQYTSLISAAFTLCYLIYGVLNSASNFYFTLIILLLLFEKNKNNNNSIDNKEIVKRKEII